MVFVAVTVLEVVGKRVGHNSLGKRHFDCLDECGENRVPRLHQLLHLLARFELASNRVAQLLQSVELADQLGERVIELWQLSLANRDNRHLHVDLLALEVTVVRRHSELGLFTFGETRDSVIEAGQQRLGADLVRQPGCR